MVFDLDQFAIGGGLGEPQHGPVINPRMARQNAVRFTGLQYNSC